MIQEEEKYREIIRLLNSLPRVKAKKGFEARLMERLRRQEDIVKTQVTEESLFNKFLSIFKPSFIPAVAVSAVILIAVIVYFSYFVSNGNDYSETNAISDPHKTEHLIYLRNDKDSYLTGKSNTDLSMNNTTSDKQSGPDYDHRSEISSLSKESPKHSNENIKADNETIVAEYNSGLEATKTESESRDNVISRNEKIGTDKKEKNTKVYDEINRLGLLPLAKAHKPEVDSSKQDSTKKNNQKDKKLKEEPEK
ncbi:MAG: hypothetical protein N2510_01630 [Ignavibacteria bacterium]|nr:hypothetical protein [Ignavibacteria bacterium]